MALGMPRLRTHISVVITGHEGHVVREPEPIEPRARRRKFGREREVDEIAGHRDVVGSA
jgi:hypothetical protein